MGKTNHEMCEIVTLRGKVRKLTEQNQDMQKGLRRAIREIETLGGEKYVINKLRGMIDE